MKRLTEIISLFCCVAVIMCAGCGGSDSSATNVAGTWRFVVTYADGYSDIWIITLAQSGSTLSGSSYEEGYPADAADIAGSVSGSSITITEIWVDDDNFTYKGTVSGSTMSGSCSYDDGSDQGTWTATKS